MHPLATETLPADPRYLKHRMGQLRATFRKDKTPNPNVAHIYYSEPLRRWLMVKRHPRTGAVIITHWATCPCALTQASA